MLMMFYPDFNFLVVAEIVFSSARPIFIKLQAE